MRLRTIAPRYGRSGGLLMLICECPHRDHDEPRETTPTMIRDHTHKYRAGIPTAVSFEVRALAGKISAQHAVCGPCVDQCH